VGITWLRCGDGRGEAGNVASRWGFRPSPQGEKRKRALAPLRMTKRGPSIDGPRSVWLRIPIRAGHGAPLVSEEVEDDHAAEVALVGVEPGHASGFLVALLAQRGGRAGVREIDPRLHHVQPEDVE